MNRATEMLKITDISFHAAQKGRDNVAGLTLMQNSILGKIHKQISRRKHAISWHIR